MDPFSKLVPKPMLPLLNKPIIGIIAERLLNAGAVDITIVTSNSNNDEIKAFFNTQKYKNKLEFCIQNPPIGTADAIYIGGINSKTDIIFSVAGDNLFSQDFFITMVEKFRNNDVSCLLAVQEVTKEEITKLASVETNSRDEVVSIIEKPKLNAVKSNIASLSMYIFNKSLLSFFKNVKKSSRGEYEAPDAFLAMMRDKNNIIKTNIISEEYIHISNPLDLWKINISLSKNRNIIDKSSTISPNAEIKNCTVGPYVSIASNVKLSDCLILANTVIEENLEYTKSVIASANNRLEVYTITE